MSNRYEKEFLGFEFIWWYGVIENIDDPLKLGRVQVRIYGWYSSDKINVPTENLPWARCSQPVTSSAISDYGVSPTGMLNGAWCWGFFEDGKSGQKPLVVGLMNGIPQELADENKSFNDPAGIFPDRIDEPDVSRLARNENISKTIVSDKIDDQTKSVNLANSTDTWDQPNIPYGAHYPFNRVLQTPNGLIIEVDDTPGRERFHWFHPKGTFVEIDPNGTYVRKIKGDNYEILERNGYIYIKGKANITVDGSSNIYVKNDVNLQVDGNINAIGKNDFNLDISGDMNVSVGETLKIRSSDMKIETFGGNLDINNSGNFNVDAENIYLNSGESSTTGLSSPVARESVSEPTFDPLEVYTIIENFLIENDDTGPVEAPIYVKNYDDPAPEPMQVDTQPGTKECVPPACTIGNRNDFSDSFKISDNYTLGQLSSNAVVSHYKLKAQVGLSKGEIVCNLMALAHCVLEPLKKNYPSMIITSGFRHGNGKSQHNRGQAADLQFPGSTKAQYYSIAQAIKNLVPYDQLLLEYASNANNPWIHISFKRNLQNRYQILTLHNHKTVGSGLRQLG